MALSARVLLDTSAYSALRRIGKPIPENDLWISASAMEHGLPILTTDRHFEWVTQVRVRLFSVR